MTRQDGCTCGKAGPADGSHLPGCHVVPFQRPDIRDQQAPWREVLIEDATEGNIGVEMRAGGKRAWLVFYGRQGGRQYTRPLDQKRARALSDTLRHAERALSEEAAKGVSER